MSSPSGHGLGDLCPHHRPWLGRPVSSPSAMAWETCVLTIGPWLGRPVSSPSDLLISIQPFGCPLKTHHTNAILNLYIAIQIILAIFKIIHMIEDERCRGRYRISFYGGGGGGWGYIYLRTKCREETTL